MKFYNRKKEIDLLSNELKKEKTFTVIYGRRRVGKTRLVEEVLKKIEHIEFFIPRKRVTPALAYFQQKLMEQEGYSPSFKTIDEFLEYLFRNFKKPIFFDEISNFRYLDPSAYSILQNLLDKHNARLIVTGSYVGIIKEIFTNAKEPLFGRSTCMLNLKPLPVSTAVKMTQDIGYNLSDSIELWCILGGVPRYIELTQGCSKFKDYVGKMLSPGSIFIEEGINVLIQEFGGKWGTYFSILESIEHGARPTEIADRIGANITSIPKYLKDLERLEVIKRQHPLLGNKRNVRYVIDDNFFTFWFKQIYPRLEEYRSNLREPSYEAIQTFLGKMMERFIIEIIKEKNIFDVTSIGSWWSRKGDEIDVVAINKDAKEILFCECKWRNRNVDWDVVEELKQKAQLVDWHNKIRKERFLIVSKSGFTKSCLEKMNDEKILHWDLKDIENKIK
jgi:AAA+ ATPase superfamily predicted ATPase